MNLSLSIFQHTKTFKWHWKLKYGKKIIAESKQGFGLRYHCVKAADRLKDQISFYGVNYDLD